MKNRRITSLLAVAVVGLCSVAGIAGQKQSNKSATQVVDSGTFGVYVGGRRVATETFTIKQLGDANVTSSEFKAEDGRATQQSELTLSATGDIRRYEWKELSPGKGQTTLEPQDEFLIQRTKTADNKTFEQPYLMPHTTMVLDDFFFSHREILVWKYLATGCRPKPGETGCLMPKAQFGIVVPRQRTSSMVTVEYVGREPITIKGEQRGMDRINMTSDLMGNWSMWFDDDHKLMKIFISPDNTEVVRE